MPLSSLSLSFSIFITGGQSLLFEGKKKCMREYNGDAAHIYCSIFDVWYDIRREAAWALV